MAGVENGGNRPPKTIKQVFTERFTTAQNAFNENPSDESQRRLHKARRELGGIYYFLDILNLPDIVLPGKEQEMMSLLSSQATRERAVRIRAELDLDEERKKRKKVEEQVVVTGHELLLARHESDKTEAEKSALRKKITAITEDVISLAITQGRIPPDQIAVDPELIADLPLAQQIALIGEVVTALCNKDDIFVREPVRESEREEEILSWRDEDIRWMQIFRYIPQEDQLRRGIRYFSVAGEETLGLKKFAKRSGLNRETVQIHRSPRPQKLNAMIEASPLEHLDRTSQLLRLRASGIAPLSYDTVGDSSSGEIASYVMKLTGQRHQEVADALGFYPSMITKWMKDPAYSLPRLDAEVLLNWLGEENIALRNIILAKNMYFPLEITPELFKKVLSGDYLFAEHMDLVGDFPMSRVDSALFIDAQSEAQRLVSEGEVHVTDKVLKFIRDERAFSDPDIVDWEGLSQNYIDIAKYIKEHLGYPFPHPIACFLLDLAAGVSIGQYENVNR